MRGETRKELNWNLHDRQEIFAIEFHRRHEEGGRFHFRRRRPESTNKSSKFCFCVVQWLCEDIRSTNNRKGTKSERGEERDHLLPISDFLARRAGEVELGKETCIRNLLVVFIVRRSSCKSPSRQHAIRASSPASLFSFLVRSSWKWLDDIFQCDGGTLSVSRHRLSDLLSGGRRLGLITGY